LKKKPHARGAEVGVFKGIFANRLLKNLPDIQTYYCIDPWAHDEDYKKTLRPRSSENKVNLNQAYKAFLKNTNNWKNKRIILQMTSMEALNRVVDESLDWVFVDGNHAYEYAREDIIGWSKKLKVGGLLAGHDYFDKMQHHRKIPFGVAKAVRELLPKKHEFSGAGPNVWWAWKESGNWINV
jgi:predicted O-methyltransferase YrrM